jgi:hypothetical protein
MYLFYSRSVLLESPYGWIKGSMHTFTLLDMACSRASSGSSSNSFLSLL